MATAGSEYTVDFLPSVGPSLTGVSLVSVAMPPSPSIRSMSITRKVDAASPKLFQMCVAGVHIKQATITCRKAGKGQQEYMIVKLNDVVVTNVSHSSTGTDTITLSFSQMTSNAPLSAAL